LRRKYLFPGKCSFDVRGFIGMKPLHM
jgi:hypothetical protein